MRRAETEARVATIKVTPHCRIAWEAASAREQLTPSNMFEFGVVIFTYYEDQGIELTKEPAEPPRRAAARKVHAYA